MKIAVPYAMSLDLPDREAGIALLRKVEWAGRISHRSEESQTADSWEKFIRAVVLGHGDWSITEHVNVQVDVVTDRGISHEWVRHRLGAYTQESTRFVNYEKKMPPSFIYPRVQDAEPDSDWVEAMEYAETKYRKLLAKGWRPQEARSVFPTGLATRLVVTYNLRMWRSFFLSRTTLEAHPQMRQVVIPLLAEFQTKIPILYEDIVPESRQVGNMQKMR